MDIRKIDFIQQEWLKQFVCQFAYRELVLNVGCGEKHMAGAINIDPNPDRAPWIDRSYDVRDLPYDDGTIGCIVSNHVLPAIDGLGKAMNEMIRVLKPGGIMAHVIPDWRYAPKRLDTRYPWDFQYQGWDGPEDFRTFIEQYIDRLDVVELSSFPDFDWSFRLVAIKRGAKVERMLDLFLGPPISTTTLAPEDWETEAHIAAATDFYHLRQRMAGRRRAD